MFPSSKAVQREREKVHEMTKSRQVLQSDSNPNWPAESALERMHELWLQHLAKLGLIRLSGTAHA